MKTIKFIEKNSSRVLSINSGKLIGVSTKSLYVRRGFTNGTLFLSQRGQGTNGAGDICPLNVSAEIEVNTNLFNRIQIYAQKAGAMLKTINRIEIYPSSLTAHTDQGVYTIDLDGTKGMFTAETWIEDLADDFANPEEVVVYLKMMDWLEA